MKLHTLKPAKGATHKEKRIGRGEASGKGGQMPIQRRIPKRGFKNNNRIEFKVINLGQIDHLSEKYGITEFNLQNLYINGLISQFDSVKVLGNGEVKGKFAFKINAISEKAKAAIEAAGGSVEIVK
jgi:large subunit ribosomal protein L15